MPLRILVLVLCISGLDSLAAFAPQDGVPERLDYFLEPRLAYEVQIGSEKYVTTDGMPFVAMIDDKPFPVRVKVLPARTFEADNLSFRYPRHFTFAIDAEDEEAPLWTLEGRQTMLNVQRISGIVSRDILEPIIEATMSEYSGSKTDSGPAALTLGGRKLVGRYLSVEDADHAVRHEFFVIEGKKAGVLIMIQHLLDEELQVSPEGQELTTSLAESFQWTGE